MEICIESLIDGAARASGAVAIIDVFRAFTTAAVAFANGATHITMVASVEEALALRDQGAGQICMGEVQGRAPQRFDFGNSPYELSQADLTGRTIIQRTSAYARHRDGGEDGAAHVCLFTGDGKRDSAGDALSRDGPDNAGGDGEEGRWRSSEDEICALYLRNLLEGRQGNPEAARQMILSGGEAAKFEDVNRPWLNPNVRSDSALDIDRYDFAIQVKMENGYPVARKFDG